MQIDIATPEEIATWPIARAKAYVETLERMQSIKRLQKAREDVAAFFELTYRYKALQWQRHLAKRLSKLKYQTGQRLLIHKPPQHGGSIFLTQRFIPWMIGNDPNLRARLLTYNITRSESFGTTILRVMQDEPYKKIFPNINIPNRTSVGSWYTDVRASFQDSQPSFRALGLETGFIGDGGDLICIDDPYANDKDPFSQKMNDNLWKTHNETIVPRMNPETNVVVMYHAWNPNDYGSRLKEQDIWEQISYPAIHDGNYNPVDFGVALAPELMPIETLIQLRDSSASMGRAAFNSLFQGIATHRDGSLFKVEMFRSVSDYRRMPNSYFIGGFDWASSAEPTADRTAFSLWYVRPDGTRTKVFAAFGRFNPNDTHTFCYQCCKYAVETFYEVAPLVFFIEEGIGAGEMYVKSIQTKCAEFGLRAEPTRGKDKEFRALPLIAAMEIGNIDYLKDDNLPSQKRAGFSFGEKWNSEWMQEALAFPNGKHDDLIDPDSLCINIAARLRLEE